MLHLPIKLLISFQLCEFVEKYEKISRINVFHRKFIVIELQNS